MTRDSKGLRTSSLDTHVIAYARRWRLPAGLRMDNRTEMYILNVNQILNANSVSTHNYMISITKRDNVRVENFYSSSVDWHHDHIEDSSHLIRTRYRTNASCARFVPDTIALLLYLYSTGHMELISLETSHR